MYTYKTKTKELAQGKRHSWFWNLGLPDSKSNECIPLLVKLLTPPKMESHLENTREWKTCGTHLPRNSPNYAMFIEISTIEMSQRSLPPAS